MILEREEFGQQSINCCGSDRPSVAIIQLCGNSDGIIDTLKSSTDNPGRLNLLNVC